VSMVNGSPQYATANAFRRALEDRLKQEAKLRGRPLDELRREFLFQRFLALLFSGPEGRWVLKGGASLLMRLTEARGPGPRIESPWSRGFRHGVERLGRVTGCMVTSP